MWEWDLKGLIKMASSSSSSSSCCSSAMVIRDRYDVFLSFRGYDTRTNFVSHLHDALLRNQIQTYMDHRLPRGQDISPALCRAIQESKISLIVFSENYAFSTWCLDELVHILQCKTRNGQIVIPVFYQVDPSHVRKQEGIYAAAFAKHEEWFRDRMNKVQKWRFALTEAANLSGWDSQVIRPDSKLVDAIVKDILRKLNHISSSDLRSLVGIGKRIEKIASLLCIDSLDVRMVGVWGMGGIGKTTLASAVFNRLYSQFEGGYFLANIREESERHGLNHLGNKLLSGLLEEAYLDMGTPFVVSNFVKNQLRRKRVLVVLDDVNNSSQLEYLAGDHDRFGPGSRIIVTTRDKQVLSNRAQAIYEVEKLDRDEALELFHLKAQINDSLATNYIEMSNQVVAYANGVPLALKVLGSFLCSKSKEEWESELRKLKVVPNMEIQNVLRLSYEGLDDEEKEIFLDIACFVKGDDRDDVQSILNACGFFADIGIRVLIDKSLITIMDNKLWMHDLLQEMGKEIIRQQSIKEPGNRSRLWNDDVYHLLENNTGTATVEGISLDMSKLDRDVYASPATFLKMKNLRLLKIYSSFLMDKHKIHFPQGLQFLPDALRYLHWDGYPLKGFPSNFVAMNLVELRMHKSRAKKLWSGVLNLDNLKKIDLSYSKHLTQIPDLSRAPNLESIDLDHCKSLVRVPSCFQNLDKLVFLRMRSCQNLKTLPEVPGNMKYIDFCKTAAKKLPSSIWSLNQLETLMLDDCKYLNYLPTYACKLKSLKRLSLDHCTSLQKFQDLPRNITWLDLSGTAIEMVPSSIECLSHLLILDMTCCERLEGLPTTLCKLKSLERLYLSRCSKFKTFPEILEPMEQLRYLDLSRTAIEEIPSSIENLIRLGVLRLNGCLNLEVVPNNIYNIQDLQLGLSGCSKFNKFPPLSGTCSLDELDFSGCNRLQVPDGLGCLSSLRILNLSGSEIESLPTSIKYLSQLSHLDLSKCENLKSLPELPPFLQLLEAHDCTSLETVSISRTELVHGLHQYYLHIVELKYCNCPKLDQNSRTNIMVDAQLRILRMATISSSILGRLFNYNNYQEALVSICYPGNQIPEWFSYQSMGSSINIKLPIGWFNSNFLGFALCAVVRAKVEYYRSDGLEFQCDSNFKTNYGESRQWTCTLRKSSWIVKTESNELILDDSDHIFQWYNCSFDLDVVKEKIKGNWSTSFYNHVTEAEFEFYPTDYDEPVDYLGVMKCGIRPLYAQVAEDIVMNVEASQPSVGHQLEFEPRESTETVSFDKEDEEEKTHPKRIREEIIIMILVLWLLFLIFMRS